MFYLSVVVGQADWGKDVMELDTDTLVVPVWRYRYGRR